MQVLCGHVRNYCQLSFMTLPPRLTSPHAPMAISLRPAQTCQGTGVQVHLRPLGPGMMQQIQSRCSGCAGSGYNCPPSKRRGGGWGKLRTERVRGIPEVERALGVSDVGHGAGGRHNKHA